MTTFAFSPGCCCCADFYLQRTVTEGPLLFTLAGAYPVGTPSIVDPDLSQNNPTATGNLAIDYKAKLAFTRLAISGFIQQHPLDLTEIVPLGWRAALHPNNFGTLSTGQGNGRLYYSQIKTFDSSIPSNVKITWSIRRVDLDGSNDTELATEFTQNGTFTTGSPNGLILHPDTNRLYWSATTAAPTPVSQRESGYVRYVDADAGGAVTTIYTQAADATSQFRLGNLALSLVDDKVIWLEDRIGPVGHADHNVRKTMVSDLDGAGADSIFSVDTKLAIFTNRIRFSQKQNRLYYEWRQTAAPQNKFVQIRSRKIDGTDEQTHIDGSQGSLPYGVVANFELGCHLEATGDEYVW